MLQVGTRNVPFLQGLNQQKKEMRAREADILSGKTVQTKMRELIRLYLEDLTFHSTLPEV